MTVRKIVKIDEEKCDGCGLCVPACAEGAIQIIGGKAKLVSEVYCDGLGACLGECPQDAISIEEREAEAFDEEKTMEHLRRLEAEGRQSSVSPQPVAHSCPGAAAMQVRERNSSEEANPGETIPSELVNWPVQLHLVPTAAPYLRNADILLAADCVPFAHADFHRNFMRGKPVIIGCPKLDDANFYVQKFSQLLRDSEVNSVTVVHMVVPCCSGLLRLAEIAIANSGHNIPLRAVTIGIQGEILSDNKYTTKEDKVKNLSHI